MDVREVGVYQNVYRALIDMEGRAYVEAFEVASVASGDLGQKDNEPKVTMKCLISPIKEHIDQYVTANVSSIAETEEDALEILYPAVMGQLAKLNRGAVTLEAMRALARDDRLQLGVYYPTKDTDGADPDSN